MIFSESSGLTIELGFLADPIGIPNNRMASFA
jgi:hypothetical protein